MLTSYSRGWSKASSQGSRCTQRAFDSDQYSAQTWSVKSSTFWTDVPLTVMVSEVQS